MPEEDSISVREAEIQILDVIQDALRPPAAPPSPATPMAGTAEPAAFVDSPLFSGFSRDELVAVIRGLRLLTFEPGDIVLTEGDPGESLFVLTEGRVKAFVRDPAQRRQMLMRELKEGDFFGEISILSGNPAPPLSPRPRAARCWSWTARPSTRSPSPIRTSAGCSRSSPSPGR